MTADFTYFARGLRVEQLKTHRTMILWLSVGVPLLTASLDFAAYYFHGESILQQKHEHTAWQLFAFHLMVMWTMLMLPMYISLQSALVSALEHQANAWKHIYSLPIPKWSIYSSKLFFFVGLLLLSSLALIVFGEVAGWLLNWLRPGLDINPSTDGWMLVRNIWKTFLIGLGMTAIQFYLSFRFRNFIVPAAFGVFVSLIGLVIKSWAYSYVSPYLWVYFSIRDQGYEAGWVNGYMWAGLGTFVVIAMGGFLATYGRDVE
ncbi:ABC transporter permease [Larkinella rosea]|uniref:ABC transporter permease n=1 Tax=Larkinella rosea TaxID=2025312 RepID=A0A3P1C467_9BACT|nr:ABC transporter permease [Larkinella rosea]RRB07866.1 hypothetical protein EHT25_08845 [Larkinella rosea]